MKPFHVGVAAEAFAAGLFARAGFDVSVQYGANQPEYDLLVSRDDRFLKVSVKGSQSGGWGLVQSHKKGRGYAEAIEHWAEQQSQGVVYCLVQFQGVELDQCPRVYLATVSEVAEALKRSRANAGSTRLREQWAYKRGIAAGAEEAIPNAWKFSEARVSQMLQSAA
ncbi:hypothetical protein AACH06_29210 [Ideonella sp. DXS29W]|uniref:PD(D/E)XK endonuclease domain-containing protein n=1 Tax=Ideonella lacteola TaxID=2984193 RepID=A0ABU9BY53_9BURK